MRRRTRSRLRGLPCMRLPWDEGSDAVFDDGGGPKSSRPGRELQIGDAVSTTTGDALVEAALEGGREAFERLVEPHRRAIHVHCYRMLGSFHDAEEATQETLLRAWTALSTYDARAPFDHWLYRIATNTAL